MIDINIADYYNPDYDVIDIRDSPNILYNGFCFKIGLNYLTLYYNDEQIANAKLTKSSNTIKNNTEFNKLVEGALGVFDEEAPVSENDINELIDAVDYFIAESLNSDAELNYKGFKNTLLDNPSDEKALIKLAHIMEDEFKIKGVNNEGERNYYYFDSGINSYLPLDELKYQELVFKEHGITLRSVSAKNSLETIICDKEMAQDIWEFKDHYFNSTTNEIISKDNLDEPILTKRQFKLNGELVNYNPNVNFNNSNPTLWEKTIKEITIPKNDKENDINYKNSLGIFSSCLEQNNRYKMLPIFYNPVGDNGKTLAKDMNSLVYSGTYHEIPAGNFNDNFLFSIIDDTNMLGVDEVRYDSFKDSEDLLKRLSAGGLNSLGVRKMRSDKRYKSKGMGTLIIFTNDIPEFRMKEALLNRLIFIELPNRFVDNPQLPNEYQKDEHLTDKLLYDFEGFEWYCNVLVKAKKEFKKPVQSEEFKRAVLYKNSELGSFLIANYKFNENSKLKTADIIDDLRKNINLYNKLTENGKNISITLGKQIKAIFGDDIKGRYTENNTVIYRLERIEE